jgi:hypothetical protein
MDIDDLIYPLLVDSLPELDSGEVLDIVEEFKHPRGLDVLDEFKDEIWQKYLALREQLQAEPGCNAEACQPRSVAAKAQPPAKPVLLLDN